MSLVNIEESSSSSGYDDFDHDPQRPRSRPKKTMKSHHNSGSHSVQVTRRHDLLLQNKATYGSTPQIEITKYTDKVC